jgi:hypothetical protein
MKRKIGIQLLCSTRKYRISTVLKLTTEIVCSTKSFWLALTEVDTEFWNRKRKKKESQIQSGPLVLVQQICGTFLVSHTSRIRKVVIDLPRL